MQLQAIGFKSLAGVVAIVLLAPILMALIIRRSAGTINHIGFWSVAAVAGLTLVGLLLSLMNRNVGILAGKLVVNSTFYSTQVPIVRIDDVRVVASGSSDDPVGLRINGIGLPGFYSGWFGSKRGGRIFVDRGRGEYLLISVGGSPSLALQFSDNQAASALIAQAAKKGVNQ